MGRPPQDPSQRRDAHVQIRLTAIEKAKLEERAAVVGLNVSDFVRKRSLGTPLPPMAADRRSRDLLSMSLLRIGNNLNQLTRHMNAGKPVPSELPEVLAAVRSHLDELRALEEPPPEGTL